MQSLGTTTMNPIDPRHDPPLSETDIQAYADGFLTPERAAHLRLYLGKRPGEARRVAFYGKLNERIQHAFVPTDEPLPDLASGQAVIRTAPGRWLERCIRVVTLRPLRALLALILSVVLALLAASGWMAASHVSEEALNNAAVMALAQATDGHLGAAAGSPHGVNAGVSAGGNAAAAGTMAPATTASGAAAGVVAPAPLVAAPDAPNLAPVDMHLVSCQTLKLGPLARATEYVYLNAQNQPVVLLVARSRSVSAQTQWSAQRVGTLRLLIWGAHHQRYVLAGAADARGLMRAADFMTMR
jgi:anti-sigma factor RsiW